MSEFECDICEKVFKTKTILLKHYNHIHNNSGKIYQCTVCAKNLQTQKILKVHIKIVHGSTKEYNCESCEFSEPGNKFDATHS